MVEEQHQQRELGICSTSWIPGGKPQAGADQLELLL